MPDFPLLNVFGFGCYTFSTAVFLFSPLIRDQYAHRHPLSPEPTNRINDLAFGALGFTMSVVTYSQFWPCLWGWKQVPGVTRHATKITLGLISGSIFALAISVLVVWVNGDPADPTAWAWIDVVSGIPKDEKIYGCGHYSECSIAFRYQESISTNCFTLTRHSHL